MTKGLVGLIVLGLVVAPAIAAAQDAIAVRVQGALDARMTQPECKLDGGDLRVSSGKTYLKTGIEGSGDPCHRGPDDGQRRPRAQHDTKIRAGVALLSGGPVDNRLKWLPQVDVGRVVHQTDDLRG